ncbi:hypothetical protein ACFXG4_47490 [Nocardia sp. NPDC059246]|uniref:hypothetical protein n=1 Tax=unclassified Nocardia TaxID=2637762 RepID=UPI0036C87BB6
MVTPVIHSSTISISICLDQHLLDDLAALGVADRAEGVLGAGDQIEWDGEARDPRLELDRRVQLDAEPLGDPVVHLARAELEAEFIAPSLHVVHRFSVVRLHSACRSGPTPSGMYCHDSMHVPLYFAGGRVVRREADSQRISGAEHYTQHAKLTPRHQLQ